MDHLVGIKGGPLSDTPSIGAVCGKVSLPTEPKVHIVETKSMAAQHDHVNGVDGLEASVFDGAHPGTPRVDVIERKI